MGDHGFWFIEKSTVVEMADQFRQWVRDRQICVIEGDHSSENTTFRNYANPRERGIHSIIESLTRQGLTTIHVKTTDPDLIQSVMSSEFAFIYAHGEFGEDGRIQGLLDVAQRPYQGPGVEGSVRCHNKTLTKLGVQPSCSRSQGTILLPKHAEWVDGKSPITVLMQCGMGYPIMLKPRRGGSSVGIMKVDSGTDLTRVCGGEDLEDYYGEEFIDGQFVTIGAVEVNGEIRITPLLGVSHQAIFYDESVKLGNGDTKISCEIFHEQDMENLAELHDFIESSYRESNSKGIVRYDFIMADNAYYFLEINSIPGLAEGSNLTSLFRDLGVDYDDLVCFAMAAGNGSLFQS